MQERAIAGSWSFCWWVALRYLWSRRGEAGITIITIISIVGVAIGVVTLNMVMAVMTGFQTELKEKILGADAHITVRHFAGNINDWKKLQPVIARAPGVESVSAYTYQQALIQTKLGASGLIVRGIESRSSAATQLQTYMPQNTSLDGLFTPLIEEVIDPVTNEPRTVAMPGIVIGKELAKNLDLHVGSVVTLLTPQTTSTPFGLTPRFKRFRVVAIYASGLIEYESGLAYIAMNEAQSFFRMEEKITAFEVRVHDVDSAPSVAKTIVEELHKNEHGFYTKDWTEVNAAFFEAFKLEKRVYFIVLLLIIVMASFSIVSSLIMIVLEKRKDIAILKVLGTHHRSIGFIFNLQGAVIGAIGVTVGTLAGLLGCFLLDTYGFPIDQRIFQMATLPVKIVPSNFFMVALCSFGICCLATIYPARRASKLHPSEVLRYE
jgi:lipoprotein-releasing system permease protein